MEIAVPRDRAGSFEPQLVKKRRLRLGGVDEMVLSLSAKGLTHGAISAGPAEVYGAEVSKSTISTTGSAIAGMTERQNSPLDSVCPGPLVVGGGAPAVLGLPQAGGGHIFEVESEEVGDGGGGVPQDVAQFLAQLLAGGNGVGTVRRGHNVRPVVGGYSAHRSSGTPWKHFDPPRRRCRYPAGFGSGRMASWPTPTRSPS